MHSTVIPTIIFATNNAHKVTEVRAVLGNKYQVLPLQEAGILVDIPEPFNTLEANAHEKCRVIFELTGNNCFSEDTGLEVFALNGEPGVLSARYAGENRSAADNMQKLLHNLRDVSNRKAQFKTVISLVWNGEWHQFTGICEGQIINEPRGTAGFGYDPIFVPDGANKTFAEMNMNEKNEFSHRKKATQQLLHFLLKQ